MCTRACIKRDREICWSGWCGYSRVFIYHQLELEKLNFFRNGDRRMKVYKIAAFKKDENSHWPLQKNTAFPLHKVLGAGKAISVYEKVSLWHMMESLRS